MNLKDCRGKLEKNPFFLGWPPGNPPFSFSGPLPPFPKLVARCFFKGGKTSEFPRFLMGDHIFLCPLFGVRVFGGVPYSGDFPKSFSPPGFFFFSYWPFGGFFSPFPLFSFSQIFRRGAIAISIVLGVIAFPTFRSSDLTGLKMRIKKGGGFGIVFLPQKTQHSPPKNLAPVLGQG